MCPGFWVHITGCGTAIFFNRPIGIHRWLDLCRWHPVWTSASYRQASEVRNGTHRWMAENPAIALASSSEIVTLGAAVSGVGVAVSGVGAAVSGVTAAGAVADGIVSE